MGTKRSDAVDPPRPLRDKESNRQGTDPTSPYPPHLDENNLLWENQTTPLRGAPPRRDCPVDAGSRLERGRFLQKEPICHRLREVQLLQGIHCRLPVLRRGLERGRVLQEEPIYFWLREVQLLQGIHCRLPVLRRGLERGRVLQEEPIYWRLREV